MDGDLTQERHAEGLQAHFANSHAEVMKNIDATGDWNGDIEGAFKAGIEEFVKTGSW